MALGKFVPGSNILLDGIRHADIQRRIERLVKPSRAFLIHIAVEDELVSQRARGRGVSETDRLIKDDLLGAIDDGFSRSANLHLRRG